MSKRVQEPVDQWLAKEGYFRKSTPRDPTCLFRAISEQVYLTQHYHLRVRRECTEFMAKKNHLFKDFVPMPFDYYLKEMQCFTEWGGMNEIRAMSLLYKRDIIVFIGEKQICENVTNNGFKKGVLLLCHTELKQYDPVYPMAFVQSAAYCQSIVYEVVYKYMYRIPNIKTVADKMLNSRAPPALRHDRFFQRGNLDIREQLIEDLYKKVNNEHNNTDEMQSDWKGAPPISYKVARALAPDYYRNIELDIWHELKREVKYAGWNRYNSNELQIGGKCVIQISVNDLEQSDKNNNKSVSSNLSQCSNSEINNKIEQQKLKQGPIWLHGYIQEMSTEKEPVLVFIKDLGEKKLVPYDALKPLPLVKKNRPKTWGPINKSPSVISDSNRRWKKSYNSLSQKKKDTVTLTNEQSNNTNKNVSINNNDVDNVDINNINKTDFNEHDDKLPYVSSGENSSNCANEESDSLLVTALDNSQSTVSSNVTQEIMRERKKSNTAFRKANNIMKNKSEKSKNFDNTQNSNSKSKVLNKNYGLPYNGNLRTNICDNLNVSYVAPDNIYPYYPYMPGNFSVTSEHNQIDQTFALNLDYNLRHLEDTFCTLNPTYYGPLVYGPNHQGMRSLGAPLNAHVPYGQEEVGLINDMQNCSLTYNEGESASAENSVASYNTKQSKQGLKNSNGKDSLYQIQQKGKQNETVKANKIRNRQQNTRCGTSYMQYPGNQYSVPNGFTNDVRKGDIHTLQLKQHWDPSQMTPVVPGLGHNYAPPQYATSTPIFPYQEFPPHYVNEGNYGPMTYLLPQHVDADNGTTPPPYPQHFYSTTEGYLPGQSSTNGQPMMYSQPLLYPQSMQYHAVPLPVPHMPEQWNPALGPQPPYIPQCIAPTPTQTPIPGLTPIVESSPNAQGTIPKSSI
ncbi:hypothetical protein PUN28_007406 [Cardiocondyla obscurior]|uniref:OTU domain-containing protein n=1 Tax=Cardiocondyla obscurior TaxID=286306 RepID=A0AAW2G6R1_9HYME